MLARAEAADQQPLPEGLSIPAEFKRREDRLAAIRQVKAQIEARAAGRDAQEKADFDAKLLLDPLEEQRHLPAATRKLREGQRRQIDVQGIVGMPRARMPHQMPGKLGVDAPIALFVGIGQRALGHRCAKSHVVELGRSGAQTVPIRQLREGHASELVRTTEPAHPVVAAITRNDAAQCPSMTDDPPTARTPACQRT
jgi:hypothetical protein